MIKNNLRFISQSQLNEGINLYHLARAALSGEKCGKYERMCYAARELNKKYPEISGAAFYKDLSSNLE